jgi:hypothetical protein
MRKTLTKFKNRLVAECENPSWILITGGILVASTYTAIIAVSAANAQQSVLNDVDDILKTKYPDIHAEVLEYVLSKQNLV